MFVTNQNALASKYKQIAVMRGDTFSKTKGGRLNFWSDRNKTRYKHLRETPRRNKARKLC